MNTPNMPMTTRSAEEYKLKMCYETRYIYYIKSEKKLNIALSDIKNTT